MQRHLLSVVCHTLFGSPCQVLNMHFKMAGGCIILTFLHTVYYDMSSQMHCHLLLLSHVSFVRGILVHLGKCWSQICISNRYHLARPKVTFFVAVELIKHCLVCTVYLHTPQPYSLAHQSLWNSGVKASNGVGGQSHSVKVSVTNLTPHCSFLSLVKGAL